MKVLAKITEIISYGDKNMIDVIQALKNQGFMIIDDTVFDLLYQIKKHGQFVSLENAKNIIHQLQVQGYKGLEDINEKKTWHILKIVETP